MPKCFANTELLCLKFFLSTLDFQKFCVIAVLGIVYEDIAGSYLNYIWYL